MPSREAACRQAQCREPNDGSRPGAYSAAAAWPGFLQAWAAAALPQVRRRRPTSSRRARWTDFFKTGQVDAGVLEEGRERPQADKLASIDGMRAEVQQLRAIWVAAGGGDAGG
jgi:hypothetical protein